MTTFPQLQTLFATHPHTEYQCQANVNLYDSPALQDLATQAVAGRQLRVLSLPPTENGKFKEAAIQVHLCEDDYPGWLPSEDLDLLEVTETRYQAIVLSKAEIQARLSQVITYTQMAMAQPNHYLWGGTVGPNYDCSGLMQSAFAAAGIWIPRDAYQQEAFAHPIPLDALQPGDLVFFGTPQRATHVGLFLGGQDYIHSSGKEQGRNGIGIDRLSKEGDIVSQTYYRQIRGAGRIVTSYQPRSGNSSQLSDGKK